MKSLKFGLAFRNAAIYLKSKRISRTLMIVLRPVQICCSSTHSPLKTVGLLEAPPPWSGLWKFVESSITQPRIIRFCWNLISCRSIISPRRRPPVKKPEVEISRRRLPLLKFLNLEHIGRGSIYLHQIWFLEERMGKQRPRDG